MRTTVVPRIPRLPVFEPFVFRARRPTGWTARGWRRCLRRRGAIHRPYRNRLKARSAQERTR